MWASLFRTHWITKCQFSSLIPRVNLTRLSFHSSEHTVDGEFRHNADFRPFSDLLVPWIPLWRTLRFSSKTRWSSRKLRHNVSVIVMKKSTSYPRIKAQTVDYWLQMQAWHWQWGSLRTLADQISGLVWGGTAWWSLYLCTINGYGETASAIPWRLATMSCLLVLYRLRSWS